MQQIAGAGGIKRDPAQNTFQIPDRLQNLVEIVGAVLRNQILDGVQTGVEDVAIAQRLIQPAVHQATAHGGGGIIENRK